MKNSTGSDLTIYSHDGVDYIMRADLTMPERLDFDDWKKEKNVDVEMMRGDEVIRLNDWERFKEREVG